METSPDGRVKKRKAEIMISREDIEERTERQSFLSKLNNHEGWMWQGAALQEIVLRISRKRSQASGCDAIIKTDHNISLFQYIECGFRITLLNNARMNLNDKNIPFCATKWNLTSEIYKEPLEWHGSEKPLENECARACEFECYFDFF